MSQPPLKLVKKPEASSKFQMKTFFYYVIAISVTTVVLAQIASWAWAYWHVKSQLTEESDNLLAEYEARKSDSQGTTTTKTRSRSKTAQSGTTTGEDEDGSATDNTGPSADEMAIRRARNVLSMDPNQVSTRIDLASKLLQAKRTNEAVQVLKEGTQISPYSQKIREMLAQALEKDGQLEGALEEYKALVFMDSKATNNIVAVARMHEALGRSDDALAWYRRAASQDGKYDSVYQSAMKRLAKQ